MKVFNKKKTFNVNIAEGKRKSEMFMKMSEK